MTSSVASDCIHWMLTVRESPIGIGCVVWALRPSVTEIKSRIDSWIAGRIFTPYKHGTCIGPYRAVDPKEQQLIEYTSH
jgi:hypothetical protein